VIFIGTVLLEKNRWSTRVPSYKVSAWVKCFKDDGFDGMELWENHVLMSGAEEAAAIKNSGFPVRIFNSYAGFDDASRNARIKVVSFAKAFNVEAVKFNFGNDARLVDDYIKNLEEMIRLLPNCNLLCECHPGTVMDDINMVCRVNEALGPNKFQVIIHPFADLNKTEKWLEKLGPIITHMHLQLRDPKLVRLSKRPSLVKKSFEVIKKSGYRGSYTIEFTEGVAVPDENIHDLYKNALDDLAFLREII